MKSTVVYAILVLDGTTGWVITDNDANDFLRKAKYYRGVLARINQQLADEDE